MDGIYSIILSVLFKQNATITVLVHDFRVLGQILDPIDIFTVKINSVEFPASPPTTYAGFYDIATISLRYSLLETFDPNTSVLPQQDNANNEINAGKNADRVRSFNCHTSQSILVSSTVTGTALQSPTPGGQTVTSTRPFLPFAVAMTVVAVMAILGLVITIGATLYMTKKHKGLSKGIYKSSSK